MTDMTLTLMGFLGVSMTFAAAGIIGTFFYFDKFKRMKRRYEIQSENYEYAKKKYVEQEQHNKEMRSDYEHLLASGSRNLKWIEKNIPYIKGMPQQGIISVVGQSTRSSNLRFAIKSFMYDPNDPSDREFAIRQAEELIETINNF